MAPGGPHEVRGQLCSLPLNDLQHWVYCVFFLRLTTSVVTDNDTKDFTEFLKGLNTGHIFKMLDIDWHVTWCMQRNFLSLSPQRRTEEDREC